MFRSFRVYAICLFVLILQGRGSAEATINSHCLVESTSLRSFECLRWLSAVAINSLEAASPCQTHVHVPLLMCIIKREIGSFEFYSDKGGEEAQYCTVRGCGLSQMTENGVETVRRALGDPALEAAWLNYWTHLGLDSGRIKQPQELSRRDAMLPTYGLGMALMHLCEEVRALDERGDRITPYRLAYDYNGHPQYREDFAREVTDCLIQGDWQKVPLKKVEKSGAPSTELENKIHSDSKAGLKEKKGPKVNSKVSQKKGKLDSELPFTFYNVPHWGIVKINTKDLTRLKKKIEKGEPILPQDFEFLK